MINAMALAALWRRNKAINDEWMDDYCARTGLTREDAIAERKARWIHDDSANKLGTYQGYELSVIQIGGDKWRYTVITPWGMSEGLGDLQKRDDGAATTHLTNVIKEMAALPDKNDRKPTKMKKTPPSDAVRVMRASETSPEPAPKRKRGRPSGSRDTKPRKRRANAKGSEDVPSRLPMSTIGTRITNDVAWRPNGHGDYDPLPVWVYEGHEFVVIDGWFVDIPSDCVRSDDGRTPDAVLRALVA